MSIKANKALIRRYVDDVWNKGDIRAVHTYFEKSLADYNDMWIEMWRTALPDARMLVDAMIAEGDYVVVHLTMSGTHLGELKGELISDITAPLPPTGRRLEAAAIVIYEIADGRIVRVPYGVMDWLTMLRHLSGS